MFCPHPCTKLFDLRVGWSHRGWSSAQLGRAQAQGLIVPWLPYSWVGRWCHFGAVNFLLPQMAFRGIMEDSRL